MKMKIQTYFLLHASVRAVALAIIMFGLALIYVNVTADRGEKLSNSYARIFNITSIAGKSVEYKNYRLNEQNGKLKYSQKN